jgi:hypothetical protein
MAAIYDFLAYGDPSLPASQGAADSGSPSDRSHDRSKHTDLQAQAAVSPETGRVRVPGSGSAVLESDFKSAARRHAILAVGSSLPKIQYAFVKNGGSNLFLIRRSWAENIIKDDPFRNFERISDQEVLP